MIQLKMYLKEIGRVELLTHDEMTLKKDFRRR